MARNGSKRVSKKRVQRVPIQETQIQEGPLMKPGYQVRGGGVPQYPVPVPSTHYPGYHYPYPTTRYMPSAVGTGARLQADGVHRLLLVRRPCRYTTIRTPLLGHPIGTLRKLY